MTKIKLIFENNTDTRDVDFQLIENEVSVIWIKKIKHLKHIPFDPVETTGFDFSDIDSHYKNFCTLSGVEYQRMDYSNQDTLNHLHELYEKNHERLSTVPNNNALYIFHHAIHDQEFKHEKKDFYVGWGIREGILTSSYPCNKFYSDVVEANCLYLPWSELGKTPLTYYNNQEPNDVSRFLQLAKPHITLRARFMIAADSRPSQTFPKEFEEWFEHYKNDWLQHHNIEQWRPCDEFSAVPLAQPVNDVDMKTIINTHPTLKKVELW